MILVSGEALMDFLPARSDVGEPAYLPRPGGSPYNVAVALARIGVPTGFAGWVSTDFFGDMLIANLRASGVSLDYLERREQPTTLAFASVDLAEPAYAFYGTEADDRHWGLLVSLPTGPVRAVHVGSLALVREPAAAAYEGLIGRARARGVAVSLDPNIRPEHITDADGHRARLQRLAALADVVKLSRADLAWIAPGVSEADYAAGLLAAGTSLVVVTVGGAGAAAYGRAVAARCPAEPVQLVDTVGAGDAFMAGLLAGLWEANRLDPAAIRELPEPELGRALRLAARVAALTCTRRGADPPWRRELGALDA
jgi:fructokinase